MKVSLTIFSLCIVAFIATGCGVSKQEYDSLRSVYLRNMEITAELERQNKLLEESLAQCQQKSQTMSEAIASRDKLSQSQIDELSSNIATLAAREKAMEAKLAALKAENSELLDAVNTINDPELNDALKKLASDNQGLLDYDQKHGMVKFKSDYTFDIGSATLRPEAEKALAELAAILNKGAAKKFEVRIVGHTDNSPVVKAATKAKFHNNWMLSTFRANSVREHLGKSGIASDRAMIAGYGPYRPIAPNTKAGKAKNRRVEIYLTAMTKSKYKIMAAEPSVDMLPSEEPVEAEPTKGGTVEEKENPALYK